MLKKHEQKQIEELFKAGLDAKEVSKRTGRSLGTVYKYRQLSERVKAKNVDLIGIPEELKDYQEQIDRGIKRKTKLRDIFFEMQKEGYNDSRLTLESYYKERKQDLNPKRTIKHLVTAPGAQAQVDWAHYGELTVAGKVEKVSLFVYTLGWSRATYLEFVIHQNQRTLQACHVHAFEKLGIPKKILYDNMKTVVTRREKLPDGNKKIHYNLAFTDFSRYYQFEAEACSPYWPRHKGKVERTIRYIRGYFSRYTPKSKFTLDELNAMLTKWVDETANQRIHRSTGQKPHVLWQQEKTNLEFPTDLPTYNATPVVYKYATQYGLIIYRGITYNLGSAYARKKLEIREIQEHGLAQLEFYYADVLQKTVVIPSKKHSWVTVFEDEPIATSVEPTKPLLQSDQPRHKTPRVIVKERDISYYHIFPNVREEVNYG